jgi:hypothetical protein
MKRDNQYDAEISHLQHNSVNLPAIWYARWLVFWRCQLVAAFSDSLLKVTAWSVTNEGGKKRASSSVVRFT